MFRRLPLRADSVSFHDVLAEETRWGDIFHLGFIRDLQD